MGRTPDTYRNQKITGRLSYDIQSRVNAETNQQEVSFPSGSFLYEGQGVFEVHRLIPRVFSINANGDILEDLGADGLALVDVMIRGTNREQEMTKRATPLICLTLGSAERTWEWPEPYYLDKTEGFVVTFNVADLSQFYAPEDVPLLRVSLSFQGFILDFKGA